MREDWIEVEADFIGELIRGITYNKNQASDIPKNDYLPILRANNINENRLNFESIKYVDAKLISENQKILANDILIAMSSGSKNLVGKSAQAKSDYNGSFGAFCAVYRPDLSINGNFISYFFQSNEFRRNISEISKGSNINNLKREHILNFVFPLAPLPIQRAIVYKIEALFSDLDNGIAHFKKAQAQLKIYRQAVLKKAFEGFNEVLFEELITSSQNGLSKRSGSEGNEIKVLRLADIANLAIDSTLPRSILLSNKEFERYKLNEGDLLAIRVNGSIDLVGRLIHVSQKDESEVWAFCDHLIRFILDKDRCVPIFYYYFFQLPQVRKFIHQNMVSSAGQNTVSQGTVKFVFVPITSKEEQTQIVQEIERRLSVCDKMEQSIKESIEKAEALRQSILKKAFEGKLLSQSEIAQCKQEADYEPASELLKKIKADASTRSAQGKMAILRQAQDAKIKKPTVKNKSKQ